MKLIKALDIIVKYALATIGLCFLGFMVMTVSMRMFSIPAWAGLIITALMVYFVVRIYQGFSDEL